ncbi:hypothetical protein ACVIM8_005669 [Bradyrhizobium sp. USDA 4529]
MRALAIVRMPTTYPFCDCVRVQCAAQSYDSSLLRQYRRAQTNMCSKHAAWPQADTYG